MSLAADQLAVRHADLELLAAPTAAAHSGSGNVRCSRLSPGHAGADHLLLTFGRCVLLGRSGHVLLDHLHGGAEVSALDRVDDRQVPIS